MASRRTPRSPASTEELTSFVGRRNDLITVRQLFAATRLVTLTGMGGVGKSRLALKAAAEMRRAFPDGVHVVEIAALTDPALLPHTVLDVLQIREPSAREPLHVLTQMLREQHLLLILDNCEHLVDAVADLADHILRAAPHVSILATSRHALRVAGEHIYPVPPLLVPDPADSVQPTATTHYPSIALFADRAAAVVPGFQVTPDNQAAVIRLCHRLEGIPLAIELAAVRLRVLTVDDLAQRVDDRFRLLRENSRNKPRRHQTLQALIDWSHDLCTPTEQLLWARCAVFAGTFDEEGMEAVCTDEALPEDIVLDTIAGLVDKSIVLREEHGGHIRFRMLETIREYGRALLETSGTRSEYARRHRDWYAELLRRADSEWTSSLQQTWATRLQLEHPNLRVALEYCMSTPGEARTGLRMAALPWFWAAMEHFPEGRLWVERGLALDPSSSHERAWGLASAAYFAAYQNDEAASALRGQQALELAQQLDDTAALAFASHVRGLHLSMGLEPNAALPHFATAVELYQRSKIPQQYPDSVRVAWATTLVLDHQREEAEAIIDEMYERLAAVSERWTLSYALWLRGLVALLRHLPERAESVLAESLRIKQPFHDTLGVAFVLEVLAWTAVSSEEYERAALLMGGTDQIWESLGATQLRPGRHHFAGKARRAIGDAAFEAAVARGTRMTLEESIAFGLREAESPRSAQPVPTSGAASSLTRREAEVAELVASGLSNKEIAERLVISLRTAEGHVEKILKKLDFKSRTQIANWVMRSR